MLGDPIGGISGMNVSIQIALVSAKRVFSVLDTHPTIKDCPFGKGYPECSGRSDIQRSFI